MEDDVDPRGRETEEEVRLDDLEPLVHHGGRVDRDLRPHLPRRVRERLLDRDRAERLEVPLAERSARAGQDDAAHLVARPHRSACGWRCARVDRKDLGARSPGGRDQELSRDDERFLVRQREALAGSDRRVRRTESDRSDEPGDDEVRLRQRRRLFEARGARRDSAPEARRKERPQAGRPPPARPRRSPARAGRPAARGGRPTARRRARRREPVGESGDDVEVPAREPVDPKPNCFHEPSIIRRPGGVSAQ